jgi:hypothetical protein
VRAGVVRRWSVVAAGLAALCSLPVLASALPVSGPALTARQLRGRILASADESYAGYAESSATLGLPPLPGLTDVTSLLDGVTKMLVWTASPEEWRVDVLSDAGERDTYQLGSRSYVWDSGEELLTEVLGQPPLRLPRPADLVPPALAVRLLDEAGPRAAFTVIPPLRVAGQSAAGLRVTPADPASTVGHIDIWASGVSGLPLMVKVFARGSSRPALVSQFFQVSPWRPAAAVLTPVRGPGTGFTTTSASDLSGALNDLGPVLLPTELAGRARAAALPPYYSIGVYGGGLATFVVLAVHRSGLDLVANALSAGGTALSVPDGSGALIQAPLLNAVILAPARFFLTYLIAGTVSASLLERAAGTLVADQGVPP